MVPLVGACSLAPGDLLAVLGIWIYHSIFCLCCACLCLHCFLFVRACVHAHISPFWRTLSVLQINTRLLLSEISQISLRNQSASALSIAGQIRSHSSTCWTVLFSENRYHPKFSDILVPNCCVWLNQSS